MYQKSPYIEFVMALLSFFCSEFINCYGFTYVFKVMLWLLMNHGITEVQW